jgi:outer membrane protein, heavy metal efflux system
MKPRIAALVRAAGGPLIGLCLLSVASLASGLAPGFASGNPGSGAAPRPAGSGAVSPDQPQTAGALPSGTAPPVETLVAAALAENPSVAALRSRLGSAREMIAPASALADPTVEGMYTEAGFPGWTVGRVEMSMFGVEVRQDLSRKSKRDAREAVARADAETREADVEALRRQVARDVRTLYARVYAIDQEIQNLAPGRELLDLLAATTSSRYGAGQGDQEGLIKAQLMQTRLAERQTDLLAQRRLTVAALGRLTNSRGPFSLGRVSGLEPVAFPEADWNELAADASAEIAAKQKAVAAAGKRVDSARLDLKPNMSAAAGAYYRGSIDPVVTLKFGLELPWWRKKKQEPLVRAAELDLEAARRELDAELARVREMTTRIATAREQSESQLERYREGILPQTSAVFDAARSAYLAGRGPFSTLIEDFNLWLEARTEVARRESDRYMAWAELQALTTPAPDVAATPAAGGPER